ncbi:hypothetical protein IV203_010043 [Nitzschia inconspicua]|uniref:F-box domain-containing protein n=1 Tax=Nitzschia inconspicua TaxID=303405 RepID=A0A9K3PKL0_9STRA|nr:hypothetical protein IV203_010043 [Nitzschia inconspicua]
MDAGNESIQKLVPHLSQQTAIRSSGSSSSCLPSDIEDKEITKHMVDAKVAISKGRKRSLPSLTGDSTNTKPAVQSATSRGNVVTSASPGTPSISTTSYVRDSSSGSGTGSSSLDNTDEQDSSGHVSGSNSNASRGDVAAPTAAAGLRYKNGDPSHQHLNPHQHHRRRYQLGNDIDDGSSLQVPEDDGSDRLAANSGKGVAQPALVVASRCNVANTSSASGGSGGEEQGQSHCSHHYFLLTPHKEPGYNTIRKTLNRFPASKKRAEATIKSTRQAAGHNSASTTTDSTSSMDEDRACKTKNRMKHGSNESFPRKSLCTLENKMKRKRSSSSSLDNSEQEGNGGGSSSGSGTEGTEGGYAGSASSNESGRPQGSCSSPSVSSSEESQMLSHHQSKRLKSKSNEGVSSSSEIADFGSSCSETADDELRPEDFHLHSPSPSLSSCNDNCSNNLEESYLSAKRAADHEHERLLQSIIRKRKATQEDKTPMVASNSNSNALTLPKSKRLTVKNLNCRPPILTVGSDVMAHILTFMHPPDILDILTMPVCKSWQRNFTQSPELWRVLCLVEPFKANMDEEFSSEDGSNNDSSSDSDDSFCSMGIGRHQKSTLYKYRNLYSAFVRCMKYLSQIREDAISGRPPAYIDYGYRGSTSSSAVAACQKPSQSYYPPALHAGENMNLRNFLAEAKGIVMRSRENSESEETSNRPRDVPILNSAAQVLSVSKKRKRTSKNQEKKGLKFGPSIITGRLLGPTTAGEAGNMNLPWSCAIYSIVNWMTAYSEVEGIQTLCLKVLPCILEDEQQRQTAQTARLTDVVLKAMVMFPKSEQLHIAAFHTIVLLARPHGGQEGMLFHSSMLASGIFGVNRLRGKSGIAVMLDSMLRFQGSPLLLAMSCWALVNIALAPEQKAALVKLGGIQATINAMSNHPYSAEVQFRAMFALINLVIPSVTEMGDEGIENINEGVNGQGSMASANPVAVPEDAAAIAAHRDVDDISVNDEREIINELVGEITSLVVRAMKNFCSSEAILNRACLVLHNLSLTEDYHTILLWTPQCYQMLEWCVTNYRTDQVLQQSATGTLHRLRLTLSLHEDIRARFRDSLRTQQHISLEQAHKEAKRLNEQQQALLANAREAAAATNLEPN